MLTKKRLEEAENRIIFLLTNMVEAFQYDINFIVPWKLVMPLCQKDESHHVSMDNTDEEDRSGNFRWMVKDRGEGLNHI